MITHPAPDALRLYNCISTRFAPTEQTAALLCECGESLGSMDELEAGICFNCQAEAAGCTNGQPLRLPIFLPFLQMKGLSA
jgi:hypothetical protein